MVLLLSCAILWSCSSRSVRQEFSGSRDLFVGWLDLHPEDFRKFGYPTKEEWVHDISDLNVSLKEFVAKYLKDFNVSGASSINERPPASGYVIQFSNVAIDPQTSIVADISIKDGTSGKVIKKFTSYGTSFNISYSMYAFIGRLNNACYALAYDIYVQMTDE